MEEKNKKSKKMIYNIAMFICSLSVFCIMSAMNIGFIAFGSMFMIVVELIVLFTVFLYLEEQVTKKKLKQYFSVTGFYLLSVLIPLVISLIFFLICKFIVKNAVLNIFSNMLLVNCGTMGIFLGIKVLIKTILKKMHKIE